MKRKVIYNGIWATASYAILFVIGLYNRRLFLEQYDSFLLGYQGVFANIFSIISVTEMGVGTVVSYRLYKEIADRNEHEIAKLMMIYKWMYRFIGLIVIMIGLSVIPVLGKIVGNFSESANTEMYYMYFIHLVGTISTYFMSFRRLLYICDQKNYVCVIVDTISSMSIGFIKIIFALTSVSYLIYFGVDIIGSVGSNIVIAMLCNRAYPYARKVKVTLSDIKACHFFGDVGYYSFQRVALAVYGGVDNIISSHFLGIGSVVYLTNYTTIESNVTNLFDKIMSGLQAAIGNIVNGDKKRTKDTYVILSEFGHFLAVFICVSYFLLYQNFISLWLGEDFTLSFWFVLLFSLNQYIGWNHRVIAYYRAAVGYFEYDLVFSIVGAILNIVLSIIFVNIMGFSGLILGTLVSHVVLWIGRTNVVYHYVFDNERTTMYWMKEVTKFIVLLLAMGISFVITYRLPYDFISLLIRGFSALMVSGVIIVLFYRKSSSVMYVRCLIKEHRNN